MLTETKIIEMVKQLQELRNDFETYKEEEQIAKESERKAFADELRAAILQEVAEEYCTKSDF